MKERVGDCGSGSERKLEIATAAFSALWTKNRTEICAIFLCRSYGCLLYVLVYVCVCVSGSSATTVDIHCVCPPLHMSLFLCFCLFLLLASFWASCIFRVSFCAQNKLVNKRGGPEARTPVRPAQQRRKKETEREREIDG